MRLERTSFAKRLSTYAEATEIAGAPILEGRLLRMVGLTSKPKACAPPWARVAW